MGAWGPGGAPQVACLALGPGRGFLGPEYGVARARPWFPEGGVRMLGDQAGECVFAVDPRLAPARAAHLTLAVVVGQGRAGIRVRTVSGGAETGVLDLTLRQTVVAGGVVLAAELQLHGGQWWFVGLGREFPGGTAQVAATLGCAPAGLPWAEPQRPPAMYLPPVASVPPVAPAWAAGSAQTCRTGPVS